MKDNTYDALGFKFYISGERLFSNLYSMVGIIPFEDVDGLTVSLIKDIPDSFITDQIWLTCCYGYEYNNNYNIVGFLSYTLYLDDAFGDKRIDKLFEDLILLNYDQLDDSRKMAANCFLERYMYGNKEKTDEVLEKRNEKVKKIGFL